MHDTLTIYKKSLLFHPENKIAMAFSRSHLYPKEEKISSYLFQKLSHSARLRILLTLYREGPCTVKMLRKYHPISQPAISQHLAILRMAQLVICHERFPYTVYRIHEKNFLKALKHMQKYLDLFEGADLPKKS